MTEKLDGTNGLVFIQDATAPGADAHPLYDVAVSTSHGDYLVRAGSRNRWLALDLPKLDGVVPRDNYGFAAWTRDNADDLVSLGPGHHYGEWYGHKIARGYGLTERRFALFNVGRWRPRTLAPEDTEWWATNHLGQALCPESCTVVPTLAVAPFNEVPACVATLERQMHQRHSFAGNGFTRPEGVVIFDTAGRRYYKHLFGSVGPKSAGAAA
ncbi:RNA ligase family protein [Streptomyces sp. NPDC050507]|uniref:RNA ligase family protein n=1 Tax=Streptomyces sp. NPDC050507 TaxID=3365619 RepID=UPI0037911095